MNLSEIRRRYAESLCATVGVTAGALMDAFARVPRERFLDAGPWRVAQPLNPADPYQMTPDARPEQIYADVAIAVDPERKLNNGQPSTHARWIAAVEPRVGETMLQVGCGTGYYSAILAELVGSSGRVDAIEVDPDLARRATGCLAPWPQVRVEVGDGAEPAGSYDVIYVNAGATHARKGWLSALAPSGRMLLPLTIHVPMFPHVVGFVVCLERQGARWPARVVSPVGIYDCVGARDNETEAQLRRILSEGAAGRVRAVSVEPHARADGCLVHRNGFCLRS